MKQCYCVGWNLEKIQKVKTQKLQGKKKWKNNAFIRMCSDIKKSKFIKEQKASELLSG